MWGKIQACKMMKKDLQVISIESDMRDGWGEKKVQTVQRKKGMFLTS